MLHNLHQHQHQESVVTTSGDNQGWQPGVATRGGPTPHLRRICRRTEIPKVLHNSETHLAKATVIIIIDMIMMPIITLIIIISSIVTITSVVIIIIQLACPNSPTVPGMFC